MDDGIIVVTFEGSQTIEKAELVKNTLLQAIMGKKNEILLNLSKIDKVDLSFLQLLYSASLEASAKNKKITITEEVPKTIIEMIRLSGFDKQITSDSVKLFADFIKEEE